MKKSLFALLALLSIPMYAHAEVEDSSATTNFTVEIVDESLGLNISGNTNLGKISRRSSPELVFPGIEISNRGEVKGFLYAEVGNTSGISFGSSEGDLMAVSVVKDGEEIGSINESEKLLPDMMSALDTDGDKDGVSPGETLSDFKVVLSIKDSLPVGQLSVPIKWTLKPE